MKLIVDSDGAQPIYEQLELQIKRQINSGELSPDTMLPSIRTLAKELKIGIITAKRAYDDLTAEGFTYAVAGKGVFVARVDKEAHIASAGAKLKERLSECVGFAKANGIDKERMEDIIDGLWKDNL